MRPVLVVASDPLIQVGLQLGDRAVDPLAEGHPIELVQHRPVEALDDAVGLRAFGFGAGVIPVLARQIELILVPLARAARGCRSTPFPGRSAPETASPRAD